MRTIPTLIVALVLISFARPARAQADRCSATTSAQQNLRINFSNVMCTVPQLFSPNGLIINQVTGPVTNTEVEEGGVFPFSKQDILTSLNSNIASQIALLPFVAPASGITFTFDKSLGIYTDSTDSFGPLFGERADTIGKYHFSFGLAYQRSDFNSLDGVNLHDFPTIQVQDRVGGSGPCLLGTNDLGSRCSFVRDYIKSTNRIDLHIRQLTSFATIGLTKWLDLSVAVPVLQVEMSAIADAHIVSNSRGFAAPFLSRTWFVHWDPKGLVRRCPVPTDPSCLTDSFSNAQHASGLGDITVRAKGKIWSGESSGVALGIDIRVPTGDEKNFLGAGAMGLKPFAAWSRGGRVSPYVNVGYQWNGDSILGGDIAAGTKAKLPNDFLYNFGVEVALRKRLTTTFEIMGQRIFDGNRVKLGQTLAPGACTESQTCSSALPPLPETTIISSKDSYGTNNASIGARFRPFGKFLLTASVQLKLDNGGLRSEAVPLVSATYTFR